MSALFSMMRNEFIPASRSLMPVHRPEKLAPTIRTSTFLTMELVELGAGSVMRVPSLPDSNRRTQRERGERRRFREAIGELRESSAGQAARHAGPRAKFSVRHEYLRHGRVRQGEWSRRAGLRPRQRE